MARRGESQDAIELPVSDKMVNKTTGICEALPLTERQGGDHAGREDMRQIKAGHAAITPDVVGVLN